MGKCPRCKWKGSHAQFMKHWYKKHAKGRKKKKAGKKKVFKAPKRIKR